MSTYELHYTQTNESGLTGKSQVALKKTFDADGDDIAINHAAMHFSELKRKYPAHKQINFVKLVRFIDWQP